MLEKYTAITTIAVHDMENAVDFYGNVLGLPKLGRSKGGQLFNAGGTMIALYESGTAGTSQATCLWWKVNDVTKVVKALKKKGVTFDTNYDLAHAEKKGDIYMLDDEMRAAWFRDIDGNILGIGNF